MRKCEHWWFRWNFYCLPKIRESFSCIPGSAYHGTFCPHRILAFPSSHQASLTVRIASILVIFLSSLLCKYKTLIPPSSPKSPQQKEKSKRKDRITGSMHLDKVVAGSVQSTHREKDDTGEIISTVDCWTLPQDPQLWRFKSTSSSQRCRKMSSPSLSSSRTSTLSPSRTSTSRSSSPWCLHQVGLPPQVSVAHFSTSTWPAGGGHG